MPATSYVVNYVNSTDVVALDRTHCVGTFNPTYDVTAIYLP